jgi:hypothetical protein
MTGSSEHGNEPSGSVKCWENLVYLSDWRLLKLYSAPWCQLVTTSSICIQMMICNLWSWGSVFKRTGKRTSSVTESGIMSYFLKEVPLEIHFFSTFMNAIIPFFCSSTHFIVLSHSPPFPSGFSLSLLRMLECLSPFQNLSSHKFSLARPNFLLGLFLRAIRGWLIHQPPLVLPHLSLKWLHDWCWNEKEGFPVFLQLRGMASCVCWQLHWL